MDVFQIDAAGPHGRGLAVCAIRHVENRQPEKIHRRSHFYSRQRHPQRVLHQKCAALWRFDRVLSQPARVAWTPTGTNVPDYPKLAQLWWQNVATAVTGERTPQAAMDNLANQMDQIMARLQRAGMSHCAPKLNEKKDASQWLSNNAAPWSKLANEKPKGETVSYEKLIQAWKEGRVK